MDTVPSSPAIGESSKVRTILDLLRISKILSLVLGILFLLAAVWYGFTGSIGAAIYLVASGIVNLLLYMKMDEFTGMVNSRRYGELRDNILIWGVLSIIFGVIVGILLIVVHVELDELEKSLMHQQAVPSSKPGPPTPPP